MNIQPAQNGYVLHYSFLQACPDHTSTAECENCAYCTKIYICKTFEEALEHIAMEFCDAFDEGLFHITQEKHASKKESQTKGEEEGDEG
jgi:hypothetical protein|tara:strand:+ start:1409 stop:1675 length:267 start_codon:yes stop_codon:yes gene_type:complete